MQKDMKANILTEQAYENLESSLVLIKLLQQKVCSKDDEIILNMVLSDIKSTIENILEIQDNI